MKIEIHLFASLSKYLSAGYVDKSFIMEPRGAVTVKDILTQLGVPQDAVKLIFLNGIHAKDSDRIKDGDRLGLFPPIGGG